MNPLILRNGYETARDLQPIMMNPGDLRPLGEATREHSPKQIRKIRRSLQEFGFVFPVLVDAEYRVIAGGALVAAALDMHLPKIPVCRLADLSEARATSDKTPIRWHVEKIAGVTRTWFEWFPDKEGALLKTLVVEVGFDTDPNSPSCRREVLEAIWQTARDAQADSTMTVSSLKIVPRAR